MTKDKSVKIIMMMTKDKKTAKACAAAEQRWNKGGKEIYEAMQNNPEFVDSLEYKKYMADLKKEDL